jgi:hypothetical protein
MARASSKTSLFAFHPRDDVEDTQDSHGGWEPGRRPQAEQSSVQRAAVGLQGFTERHPVVSPKFPPSRLVDAFDQVVEPLITEITCLRSHELRLFHLVSAYIASPPGGTTG